MYTITFDRKDEEVKDDFIARALGRLLYKKAKLIRSFKEPGSLTDIQKGFFGVEHKILEIEGEGTVIYKQFNTLQSYCYMAQVELLGFRENSPTFNSLKAQLEEIADTQDTGVLIKKFLSEEEVKTA